MPVRFEGARLDLPPQIAVPGYPAIEIELYHGGPAAAGVELTCAGTVVSDRLAELAALGLDRSPWSEPALTGTIEFAALSVPPRTRRGVFPDAAADVFVAALDQLAPLVSRTGRGAPRCRSTRAGARRAGAPGRRARGDDDCAPAAA